MAALLLLLATLLPTEAHGQTREYALKAEFLERFTHFVEWPAETFSAPGSRFVVCVVGANPFGDVLEEMARARRFEDLPGDVRYLDDPAHVTGCHLVWIARSRAPDAVLAFTSGRPILTVGDTPGYAEAGVLINFVLVKGRIRFEINRAAARRSGLVFSSQLLRLARVVP